MADITNSPALTCKPCRNRTTTYAHHYINAFAEEKRRLAKTAAQASPLALFCSSTEEGPVRKLPRDRNQAVERLYLPSI